MKMKYFITITLMIILIVLTGCGDPPTRETVREETIKIGVNAPLSGPLAEYGIAIRNGLLWAQEDQKAQNFEFIFEDNEYDPKLAISAYQKLAEIDKVDLVIIFGNPTSETVAPLVDNTKVPVIAMATNTELPSRSNYLVRALPPASESSKKILEYLRTKRIKKIGIVKTQNSYLNDIHKGLLEQKNQEETVELVDTFQWGDPDFRTTLAKIKQEDYEMLGVLLGAGQIAEFHKQAKEMNVIIPTFGTDFFESISEVENAKGTMDKTVFPNFAVTAEFQKGYVQKFNSKSQIAYAGNSYDIMVMITKEVNFENPDTIIRSIKTIKDFEGKLGTYSYKEQGTDKYFNYPLFIRTVKIMELLL